MGLGAGSLTDWGSTPHESAASPDFSFCDLSHRVGEVHLPGIASFPGVVSITATTLVPESLEWKQAYLAAVLEKDRTRIVGLIHDARSKLSAGLVELAIRDSHDEVEAIEDVEYLLQALQSSLSYRNDLQNWSDVLPVYSSGSGAGPGP